MAEPILSAVMFSIIGLGALYYHFRYRNRETKQLPEAPQSPSPYRETPTDSLALRVMVAHESGHAITAWFSSYVVRIDEIKITHLRGYVAETRISSESPEALYDRVITALAGLAAEVIVMKKIGYAFESRSDLNRARVCVVAILMEAHRPIVQRLLNTYSEKDFRLDIAAMFTETPPPDVRKLLNSGYIDAKKRILSHHAGFDCLQRKLLEQRTLKTEDIEKLFGPRMWAP